MTAITTAGAGAWSATGTWTGSVVPVDGDTVTLNHAVHVDANSVVGSAPATGGTKAIVANSALTIDTGITLEVKGDVDLVNAALILSAGAIIEGNPATGVAYRINVGTAHGQANAKITATGTSGSHCVIRKKSGALGTFVGRSQSLQRAGKGTFVYTDFTDLGSSGLDAYSWWLNDGTDVLTWANCTMDNCGRFMESVGADQNSDWSMTDVVFKNSPGSVNLSTQASAALLGGATRFLLRVAFDKEYNTTSVDVTMNEVRCKTNMVFTTNSTIGAGSQDNFWYNTTTAAPIATPKSNITRWYGVKTATNPHWLQFNDGANQTFDRVILESTDTGDGVGDAIVVQPPATAKVMTVKNCILVPHSDGTRPGKIVSLLGGANLTFSMEHCTYITTGAAGVESGLGLGETYAGHAGMCSSFKSNLGWRSASSGGALINRQGGTVQDIVAAANCDYNARWNLNNGSDGNGIEGNATNIFSSGTHDANSKTLSADPFVDKARNLAKWDLSLGGPGTVANALVGLMALTSGYTVAALIDYVFAGFAVTDVTLNNAGHDSVTIGAGSYAAPVVPVFMNIQRQMRG
jgi:hypothetical protein